MADVHAPRAQLGRERRVGRAGEDRHLRRPDAIEQVGDDRLRQIAVGATYQQHRILLA